MPGRWPPYVAPPPLRKKAVSDLMGLKGKKVLVRCDLNVPLSKDMVSFYIIIFYFASNYKMHS